jgi:hypothetical protein
MNEKKCGDNNLYLHRAGISGRQARIRANTGAGLVSYREYYTP